MGQTTGQLRHDIEETRDHMSDTIDSIADRTSPRRIVERKKNRMAEKMRGMREAVMGPIEDMYEGMHRKAHDVTGTAREGMSTMTEGIKDAPEQMRRQTTGNPMAAGLVAFGAGMLVAAMFPSSRLERQAAATMQETAEPVLDELKQAGHEMAGELGESVQGAADEVKSVAKESVHQVTEQAKPSN